MTRRPPLQPDDPRHGTGNGYTNYGCRCAPCKAANRRYRLDRYGNRTVNATEATQHVQRLVAAGGTSVRIGELAQCSPSTIDNLRHGRTTNIVATIATAVLNIRPEQVAPLTEPVGPIRRPRRTLQVRSEDWMANPGRPCAKRTAVWYSTTDEGQRHAAQLCRELCPVIEECDDYAEESRAEHGVWGGRTEDERRRMRRAAARARARAAQAGAA